MKKKKTPLDSLISQMGSFMINSSKVISGSNSEIGCLVSRVLTTENESASSSRGDRRLLGVNSQPPPSLHTLEGSLQH